jgi:type IV secretory pathway VirB10-like protein
VPTPLIPCPTCACHFRAGAPRCPHCGATLSRSVRSGARTAAAVVLALALAGCPGAENGPAPAEPPEAEIADVPEITEIPKVAPVLPVPPAPEPAEPAPPPPTPPEPEPEPDPVLPPDDGGMHALYGVPSTWDPPAPRIR